MPLASTEEVRNVVSNAEKGQLGMGGHEPAAPRRILLKFVDLVNQNLDELATLLSSEHGKTFLDAKGDIQRGIEVVEFAAGAPHLLKGEFSDSAGTGIDVHRCASRSASSPASRLQLSGHDPALEVRPGARRGQLLHSQAVRTGPSVPLRLAELFTEAGLPAGVFNVVNGDKEAVDALLEDRGSRPSASSAPRRSPSTSTPPPPRTASAPSASAAPRTTW